MARRKSFIFYILLIILTPAFTYYILGILILGYGMPSYYNNEGLGVCFVSLLSGPALFYAIYWVRNKFFSKDIEFSDLNKDRSEEGYSAEKQSQKSKKSGILDIFSSKNKCKTCGTEMEYKEAMDCYYCPECHEYK